MGAPWYEELWRLAFMLAALMVLGVFFGHIALWINAGLVIYLGWHLYNLFRLDYWLRFSKKTQPPDAPGIWGEIFYQFYRLQQRNRKRKRKLGSMLKRFQESAAAMPDATVVLDDQYAIEWFNKAAEEYFGLKIKDLGKSVLHFLPDPRFSAYLKDGVTEENGSVKLLSPREPRRMLRIHVVPYARKSHLLIARDISRLQRLEQVRRDFVANVSHELRTPLTVLSGFLETMLDSGEPAMDAWQRPLTLMSQQTARMQNIVNDLLLLSRLETDEPNAAPQESVNIAALLKDIREAARALSGDKAHVIEVSVDDNARICGSNEELRSAFSNLVFNAVRYTPVNGRIWMRWYTDSEGAHFAVQDSGEGIEAHHLPRLTERFYRVDVARSRSQGGTGLGLAIVKHVLNHHGGRLRIHSEVGKGSTFICDFPLGEED